MRGPSTLAVFAIFLLSLCFQAVDARHRSRTRSCFRNEFEASSIGSLLVASFWRDIQASGCDNDKIFRVYRKYFTRDVTFKANGADLPAPPIGPGPIQSVDDINTAFIQTGIVGGFCKEKYISWAAFEVVIDEPGQSFLWKGNEVFVPKDENPAAPPPGREYTISFTGRCRPRISAINTVLAFPVGPGGGQPDAGEVSP